MSRESIQQQMNHFFRNYRNYRQGKPGSSRVWKDYSWFWSISIRRFLVKELYDFLARHIARSRLKGLGVWFVPHRWYQDETAITSLVEEYDVNVTHVGETGASVIEPLNVLLQYQCGSLQQFWIQMQIFSKNYDGSLGKQLMSITGRGVELAKGKTAVLESRKQLACPSPGNIRGIVRVWKGGTPVDTAVEVELKDPNGNSIGKTVTESGGKFAFLNLPPGDYRLIGPSVTKGDEEGIVIQRASVRSNKTTFVELTPGD